MTDNPKNFNATVLAIIDFLGGDRHTGMCLCPIHPDQRASLSVNNGEKVLVVLHCFGCKRDDDIIEFLRQHNVWPSSKCFDGPQAAGAGDQTRSAEERRKYAQEIYEQLSNYGRQMAGILKLYLQPRGLSRVPPEALLCMPDDWVKASGRDVVLRAGNAGMVLALRDRKGEFQGIQVKLRGSIPT